MALARSQCIRKNCACDMAGGVYCGCFDNCWEDLHSSQADWDTSHSLRAETHSETLQPCIPMCGQLTFAGRVPWGFSVFVRDFLYLPIRKNAAAVLVCLVVQLLLSQEHMSHVSTC